MRSVSAVLAGFITHSAAFNCLHSVVNTILRHAHPVLPATASIVNQSTTTRVLCLVWESMSMIAAGYVTARIAGSSPVAHATAMGLIQAVVTLSVMSSIQSQEPMWFWQS